MTWTPLSAYSLLQTLHILQLVHHHLIELTSYSHNCNNRKNISHGTRMPCGMIMLMMIRSYKLNNNIPPSPSSLNTNNNKKLRKERNASFMDCFFLFKGGISDESAFLLYPDRRADRSTDGSTNGYFVVHDFDLLICKEWNREKKKLQSFKRKREIKRDVNVKENKNNKGIQIISEEVWIAFEVHIV